MNYRRDGETGHLAAAEWQVWLDHHRRLLTASGRLASILRTREDWEYLLRYGYHCDGPYPNIDFTLDELTEPQRLAFRELLESALSDDEKKRGSAAWHFVCPPSPPAC